MTTTKHPRQATAVNDLVSWDLEHWPADTYPHTASRARYLLRAYKTELLDAGALSRVGRDLVVNGKAYARWLQKRGARVMCPDDLRGAARDRYEAARCGETLPETEAA